MKCCHYSKVTTRTITADEYAALAKLGALADKTASGYVHMRQLGNRHIYANLIAKGLVKAGTSRTATGEHVTLTVKGTQLMSSYTHPQCEACWIQAETTTGSDGNPVIRRPQRVVDAYIETCCYCGKPTIVGIYRRAKPEDLANCTGHRASEGL